MRVDKKVARRAVVLSGVVAATAPRARVRRARARLQPGAYCKASLLVTMGMAIVFAPACGSSRLRQASGITQAVGGQPEGRFATRRVGTANRAGVRIRADLLASESNGNQEGPLRLGPAREITADLGLFLPTAAAVADDGSLLFVDYEGVQIVKATSEGGELWRAGRAGQGPGEFNLVTRVAIDREGFVIALDPTSLEISWFDPSGTFLRRKMLPIRLRAIHSLALLDNGNIAIVGVPVDIGSHAIRVFDSELRQVAAFGRMPRSRSSRALTFWGAGGIDVTERGDLLFTVKIPYEIYRFSPDGQLQEMISGPYEFEKGADDAVVEVSDGARTGISWSPSFVPFPYVAKDLGDGWILGGVRTAAEKVAGNVIWHLFKDGMLIAEFPAPNGWSVPSVVDAQRRFLYIWWVDEEEERIYLRVPYELVAEPAKESGSPMWD